MTIYKDFSNFNCLPLSLSAGTDLGCSCSFFVVCVLIGTPDSLFSAQCVYVYRFVEGSQCF